MRAMQLGAHRGADGADVVLDHDRDVQGSIQGGIIAITAFGVRVNHVGRHGHHPVRPHALRMLAEGDCREGVPAGDAGQHRNLPPGFRDNNLDPTPAFIIRQGRELAGVRRADQPARPASMQKRTTRRRLASSSSYASVNGVTTIGKMPRHSVSIALMPFYKWF